VCLRVVVSVGLVALVVVGVAPSAGATSLWSIVTTPTRPGTFLSSLNGVSCVSATDCIAVGGVQIGDAGDGQALVERWDGTRWSIVATPKSGRLPYLWGVSCVSATDCTAVGERTVYLLGTQALVEHWDGTRWSMVATPDPISKAVELSSVSCTSATSCLAVGHYDAGSRLETTSTLVERWDGARWSIVASPDPADVSVLYDVSCVSATDCVAIGDAIVRDQSIPLVLRWNGTRLSSETSPGSVPLDAVSCTSPTNCLAVGSSGNGVSQSLAERWDGTTWSVVAGPSPGVGRLSCVSATDCIAFGFRRLPQEQSFAEQWNGIGWTAMETPNPPGGKVVNVLNAVACPSATSCIAVGASDLEGPGFLDDALVEQYTATTAPTAPAPIVGIAATPGGRGDWLVASDGNIATFGDARFYGSTGGVPMNKPIVGIAATPSGHGYWLVASDGGIFTFGDAHFYGSTGAIGLNRPIVGIAATPSGHGYWLVASDGGIFTFGDARFYGSTGAIGLNRPIVGMTATPSGHGYWLVASDGGIFTFGDARFYGSTGAMSLNRPIVGMTATSSGHGYWLVASDGGIFTFGDAHFYGSTSGISLNGPIVGMAIAPRRGHYMLVGTDGGTFAF